VAVFALLLTARELRVAGVEPCVRVVLVTVRVSVLIIMSLSGAGDVRGIILVRMRVIRVVLICARRQSQDQRCEESSVQIIHGELLQ
jgi:hypothetical protein